MKIMHICTGYPITFNGGITNYVRSLANEQVKSGDDIVVVGGKDSNFSSDEYCFRYVEYNSFFLKPFSLAMKKNFFSYRQIKKIIKHEMPDIIHIHMMLDIDLRLADFLIKNKFKYIVSLHDYSYICPRIRMFKNDNPCKNIGEECLKCANFTEQNIFINKFFNLLKIDRNRFKNKSKNFQKMYLMNKKLLENANLLLPVSNRVKEIYMQSGIHNDYVVLHIGNLTANNFQKYKRKPIKKKKIKVLFLGNFSKIKGGEEFVNITNDLDHRKFEFYFLGRCSDNEKAIMKVNKIINKGSYKQSELSKILQDYDLGCVLSIWEDNAPQVVMELLNNNVPVIGTKMGGIPDFIEDNVNGFLYDPYDNNSYRKMIQKLQKITLSDIQQLKENIVSTTTTSEHYSQLEQIYKSI